MFTMKDLCKEIVDKNKIIDELNKVIGILSGRICIHNKHICYDSNADIELTDEEQKLVGKYLNVK